MSLLSDSSLIREIAEGTNISIETLAEGAVQPCSVDLRLDSLMRRQVQTGGVITQRHMPRWKLVSCHDGLVMQPGEFYLGATMEYVTLGARHAIKMEGKSSLGRMGLEIHSTAGWVDPGFEGTSR